jgi:hypothetical protein
LTVTLKVTVFSVSFSVSRVMVTSTVPAVWKVSRWTAAS